jgi:hypothetical protein
MYLGDVEAVERGAEGVSLVEHGRPAEPDLELAEGQRLEHRLLVMGAVSPDLVVVAAERRVGIAGPGTAGPAVASDDHIVAHCGPAS